MRYEIPYMYTSSKYTKNKFVIPEGIALHTMNVQWFVCDAPSDNHAYDLICNICPSDKRPVSGKSYIRNFRCNDNNRGLLAPQNRLPHYKVGDEVFLNEPYQDFSFGVINEKLTDFQYCVTLKGYHNPYVDFSAREFCSINNCKSNV